MLNIACNADRMGTAKLKPSKEQRKMQEYTTYNQKMKKRISLVTNIPFNK